MLKPYIFAHRGAKGYCIENTIPCFKKAVKMGAGIETDIQFTRDKELVCFHDFYIKLNSKWYDLKNFILKELREIDFDDKRIIPTVSELFETFKANNNTLRYSCDIRSKKAGFRLIDCAKEYKILERIEITDHRLYYLAGLRKYNKILKLVYTLSEDIVSINKNSVNFDKLKDLKVYAINLKSWRANIHNFKEIIDNGFKCYVWGVNKKAMMKKVLNLRSNNEIVDVIYTDYPDILINLLNDKQKRKIVELEK